MNSTPVASMMWVLLASFVGSFGAVFLKSGATRLHRDLPSLVLNYRLAAGVGMYFLSSYFFVLGVRRGELSVLYPMVSLSYVWTLLWSRMFFGEPLTREKFAGVGLILLGIVFVAAGGK